MKTLHSFLCSIGVHKWGTWDEPHGLTLFEDTLKKEVTHERYKYHACRFQERVCERCNIHKTRSV